MSSVGDHNLAIECAECAIATEETTKPRSKALYAKGRSQFELGFEDEAIETLLIAIDKEPDAEGAKLAHQVLGESYALRDDTENAEFHRNLGNRSPKSGG